MINRLTGQNGIRAVKGVGDEWIIRLDTGATTGNGTGGGSGSGAGGGAPQVGVKTKGNVLFLPDTASLRAVEEKDLVDGNVYARLGDLARLDGQAALYMFDETNSDDDNGGGIICPTARTGTNGRFVQFTF